MRRVSQVQGREGYLVFMLLIVAFLTGAAVMAFEVLGFRVMAITFDSRDIVNGSLIGAILTALSAGYYLGGMLADKYPRPALLGTLIILAGLSIESVPILAPHIYNSELSNPAKTGLWGPLVGALILFAPASLVFGITSPFVIRVVSPSQEQLGRVAGRIYAISTVGSIFGTLFTTFYLMPATGTNLALRIVGGVSIMAGLLPIVWGAVASRPRQALATAVALLVVGLGATTAYAKVIYKRDTTYHQLEVHDEEYQGRTVRMLRFDNSDQSALVLNDPDEAWYHYTDYMHLSWIFKSDPKHVLMLGLGGGTIPKRLHRDHADLKIDIAELDPVIPQVAKTYFNVKEDERMKIHVADGRQYLRRSEDKFDVVFMDAYHGGRYGPTLPFTLCTKEFFEIVNKRLADDGVLAFNLIGNIEGGNRLTRSIVKTMRDVFPQVYLFPVDAKDYSLREQRNIIVICTKDKKEVSSATIIARAKKLVADRAVTIRNFASNAGDLYTKELDMRGIKTLTDDSAQPDRLLQP